MKQLMILAITSIILLACNSGHDSNKKHYNKGNLHNEGVPAERTIQNNISNTSNQIGQVSNTPAP